MNPYKRRIFEANEEQKAKRFCYRHKGFWQYTQVMDDSGHVRGAFVVEYIPEEKKAKTGI